MLLRLLRLLRRWPRRLARRAARMPRLPRPFAVRLRRVLDVDRLAHGVGPGEAARSAGGTSSSNTLATILALFWAFWLVYVNPIAVHLGRDVSLTSFAECNAMNEPWMDHKLARPLNSRRRHSCRATCGQLAAGLLTGLASPLLLLGGGASNNRNDNRAPTALAAPPVTTRAPWHYWTEGATVPSERHLAGYYTQHGTRHDRCSWTSISSTAAS